MTERVLSKIVGSKNVLSGSRTLEEFSHDLSFVPHIRPRCVVRPADSAEVQEIVNWANTTRTPLVPVSSGPPHFRGDTVPGTGGAIVLDLSRMKKIVMADPLNKVAMIEPGVTFGELQTELAKAGMSAYLPLIPRSTKSVIGSMLEREPITMPAHHWDALDPLLCMEIIFGTGDKFRTGEACGPDSIEDQWKIGIAQMSPFAPSQMEINRLMTGSQGTMGIVTWATLKCRYLSKASRAFLVTSKNLEPLIELSYQFARIRLGDNLFILNGLNLACLMGRTPRQIEELRNTLPPWVLFISFEGYGELPEDKVQYQEAEFKERSQAGQLTVSTSLAGVRAEEISRLLQQPSDEPYWKLRFKGGCQEVFFLTTLDKTPQFIEKMSDLAKLHHYPLKNIGVYLQLMVQGTSCHCEFDIYHEPYKEAARTQTKGLIHASTEEFVNLGGLFSRPYGEWADITYRRSSQTMTIQRKLKQIFDPNNILNPGKLCF